MLEDCLGLWSQSLSLDRLLFQRTRIRMISIMAKFDLDKLSLKELQALEKKIANAIVSFEQNRRKEALVAVKAKAKEFGFSLADLTGSHGKQQTTSAPKYRHPDDPTQTWSGRGRKPIWFKEAVDGGMSPETMLIK